MPKFQVVRDPELLSKSVGPREKSKSRMLLGIDLGTACGYAYGYYREGEPFKIHPFQIGQWDLSAGGYDSGAIRFVRLRHFLNALKPDLVGYELVRFTPAAEMMKGRLPIGAILARAAAPMELLGAFKATLCCWCEEHNIPCVGLSISEIKKHATGMGNANKGVMILAANEVFGLELDPETYEATGVDNVADAAFVCQLLAARYSDGLPPLEESNEAATSDT